jgi:hypothetical protein
MKSKKRTTQKQIADKFINNYTNYWKDQISIYRAGNGARVLLKPHMFSVQEDAKQLLFRRLDEWYKQLSEKDRSLFQHIVYNAKLFLTNSEF